MANKIQFKRGLLASLPTLSVGEPALVTNSGAEKVYIGTATGNKELFMASKALNYISGSYVGNGADNRVITLGVDVKRFESYGNHYQSKGLNYINGSFYITSLSGGTNVYFTNYSATKTTTGITLSAFFPVNTNGTTYIWEAWY